MRIFGNVIFFILLMNFSQVAFADPKTISVTLEVKSFSKDFVLDEKQDPADRVSSHHEVAHEYSGTYQMRIGETDFSIDEQEFTEKSNTLDREAIHLLKLIETPTCCGGSKTQLQWEILAGAGGFSSPIALNHGQRGWRDLAKGKETFGKIQSLLMTSILSDIISAIAGNLAHQLVEQGFRYKGDESLTQVLTSRHHRTIEFTSVTPRPWQLRFVQTETGSIRVTVSPRTLTARIHLPLALSGPSPSEPNCVVFHAEDQESEEKEKDLTGSTAMTYFSNFSI